MYNYGGFDKILRPILFFFWDVSNVQDYDEIWGIFIVRSAFVSDKWAEMSPEVAKNKSCAKTLFTLLICYYNLWCLRESQKQHTKKVSQQDTSSEDLNVD